MKRKAPIYTIDCFDDFPTPEAGQAFRWVSHKGDVKGYYRVLTVRPVKVRVSRGERERVRCQIERLPGKPVDGARFTVYDHPPRIKDPSRDKWSPLL